MKNKIKTFIILSGLTTTVIHMINRIKNSLNNRNFLSWEMMKNPVKSTV